MACGSSEEADRPKEGLEALLQEDFEVVIPVKNEAEGIGRVLDEIARLGVPLSKVIVVDGRSTDGTPEIAARLGARVVAQRGEGKADAVRTGFEVSRSRYLVFMDGDCTYPPEAIPTILKELERCDEVLGVRAEGRENIPRLHRLGNKVLTLFFNALFGTSLSDVLTGMYGLRREAFEGALFEASGFSIESEILAHVVGTGGRVCEVPITYRRRCGKPKLRALHGVKIALDMLRLSWRYNPAFTIFMLGGLMLVPGLVLGAYVAYHYFFTGVRYYVKGLAAIMLTLTGLMSFSMGILTVYLKRLELRLLALQRRLLEKGRREGCNPSHAPG